MPDPPKPRLLSLDVFRGLVILAMLFVNDLAGVRGAPAWMRHAPTLHDGMTFVDLVFPAFLFMVGMSLPFALARRQAPWGHVLSRAASLAFLGFLEYNGEQFAGGRLPVEAWYLLEGAGILLVWNTRWTSGAVRAAGWALLLACLLLFHGASGAGPLALRCGYWGILGLIGFSYLAACLVYLPGRGRRTALGAGLVLFLAYAAAFETLAYAHAPASPTLPLFTFAPHGAIVLMGALLGLAAREGRMREAAGLAAGYLAAGALLHLLAPGRAAFIVSKNLATVPWCLEAAGLAALAWLLLHALLARAGWAAGEGLLRDAGNNALFAYILAPVAVSAFTLLSAALGRPDLYAAWGGAFAPGLARAVLHALLLTWIAGACHRRNLRLKL